MRVLGTILIGLFVLLVAGSGGILYGFYHYGRGLPDYQKLADYRPPVVTRVHAGDGRLLSEFATEKRVFVPIRTMPRLVVNAFLSAEDKTFYNHPGIDIPGILRAMVKNVTRVRENRRPIGASTITQQVAKNFLLSSELTMTRKIKEVILAFRIERAFTKDRILELYLNEIYLGFRSYGVAAAALNYFDKSLADLTVAEAAFLAGLPKAPNSYNPRRYPEAARARRNYVLNRMIEDGYISADVAALARLEPVLVEPAAIHVGNGGQETEAQSPKDEALTRGDYFVEEVRREILDRFGSDWLYGGGLSVRTTLDPRLQTIADRALRDGLSNYDRRRGWRGPLARIEPGPNWPSQLASLPFPDDLARWRPAVVLEVDEAGAVVGLSDGSTAVVPMAELRWARSLRENGKRGPRVKSARDVLETGDVIVVEPVYEDRKGKAYPEKTMALRQFPEVNGGLVALDPHTGRVLAMTGGFSAALSEFNRVTQARRQPGSAFKPFVYLAALESGFTPSSLVLDAPFVLDQGPGLGRWRPTNFTRKFYGPSPLRLGIEKSRNLMTVRLAWKLGMDVISDYARKFRIVENMSGNIAMSLGAGETTLLRLTAAYAMLVNGGKRIEPTLIDRVQDRNGRTVFRHDRRRCPDCESTDWRSGAVPTLPDERETVADPGAAYQIVSMLEGVVQRGTGRVVRAVGKPLAGKTGTTNDNRDAWFVGFSPDLAAGVYVGYDMPRTLGNSETGSRVAAPVFRLFMEAALEGQPAIPFRVPPEVRLVRVDAATGRPATRSQGKVILEAFLPGTIPSGRETVLDGSGGKHPDGPTALEDSRRRVPGLY